MHDEHAGEIAYVRHLAQARQDAHQGAADADTEFNGAIQRTLLLGVRAEDLAEAAGLSRGRIYQIRDGGR